MDHIDKSGRLNFLTKLRNHLNESTWTIYYFTRTIFLEIPGSFEKTGSYLKICLFEIEQQNLQHFLTLYSHLLTLKIKDKIIIYTKLILDQMEKNIIDMTIFFVWTDPIRPDSTGSGSATLDFTTRVDGSVRNQIWKSSMIFWSSRTLQGKFAFLECNLSRIKMFKL